MTMVKSAAMFALTLAAIALPRLPAAAEVAAAPERPHCLSRAEQRAAIQAREAIPLAVARRTLRHRKVGELIQARLCKDSGRLIYLLTVLSRDGKVRRVTVDATNGTVIGGL
jgi:uncharacterized membrane protein YkoI